MIVTRLACLVICAAGCAGCQWIAGLKSHGLVSDSNGPPQDTPRDTPNGAPTAPYAFPYTGTYTGAYRAAPALQPTLSWTSVDGATDYKVQLGPVSDLDPAPTIDVQSSTSYTPSSALVSSSTAPYGGRWYWRVGACNANGCTWTATRYLNVGRLPDDLDGNGASDLVVGTAIAEVWIYEQVAQGGSGTPVSVTTNGPNFGRILNTGDFNGDGFSDVASYADGVNNAGNVVIGPGGDFSTPGSVTALSPAPGANFGMSALSPGDLDGDGFDDLVVVEARQLTVLGGSTGGLTATHSEIYAATMGVEFQSGVGIGDVDGDGFPDFAVSTSGGPVVVYYGGPFDQPRTPTMIGAPDNVDSWGRAIAGGDVDGDGFADIITSGVDVHTGSGMVFELHGGANGIGAPQQVFVGAQTKADFGRSLLYNRRADGSYVLAIGDTGRSWATTSSGELVSLNDEQSHQPTYGSVLGGGDFGGLGEIDIVVGGPDDGAPPCGLAQGFAAPIQGAIEIEGQLVPGDCVTGESFGMALTP